MLCRPRDGAEGDTVAATAEWVEEAVEPLGVAQRAAETQDVPPIPEATADAGDQQFAELAESFEPSVYSAVAPAADAAEAAPDFSELLGSLDYDESTPEVAGGRARRFAL